MAVWVVDLLDIVARENHCRTVSASKVFFKVVPLYFVSEIEAEAWPPGAI
jgi:hypothetical protein